MKQFLVKIAVFIGITFLIIEVGSRLLIDPVYFYKLNTFDVKKSNGLEMYSAAPTKHVDYLFVGSSRVPATINSELLSKHLSDKNVVVAGRGYMTSGIVYQALKNKLEQYPNYLEDANVIIEYTGNRAYTESFSSARMKVYESTYEGDEAMPQLLIPHLNNSSLLDYLKTSSNSAEVKQDLLLTYLFASKRSSNFVHDVLMKLDRPIFNKDDVLMAEEGGIRNDLVDAALKKAEVMTEAKREVFKQEDEFTVELLDNSSLNAIVKLVREHGGEVFLYEVPLHSMHRDLYQNRKQLMNNIVFTQWCYDHKIQFISVNPEFRYSDDDFPDIWHLSEKRRDEFTEYFLESFSRRKPVGQRSLMEINP